ncbi:MAG: tetratricopeptide repeat protein [Chthonomonas sp.]|nr:tetratricopeptide repeat protein [Chthonomonas sp.]
MHVLPSIRSLWDFSNPEKSEQVFRDMLPSGDDLYDLELRTQIARTYGLRRRFDDARTELASALADAPTEPSRFHVRYELEIGRTENSSGNIEDAKPHFHRAFELAQELGEEFLLVDAAHMLGIAYTGEAGLEWNLRAIELAKAARDPETQTWLGSLLNNTGWTLHDMGKFESALSIFQDAEQYFRARESADRLHIARWSVARCLRSLGRTDEALATQLELIPDDTSGYAAEEVGECMLELGRAEEAKPYFATAAEKLSKDDWFVANCADRLARLRDLGSN